MFYAALKAGAEMAAYAGDGERAGIYAEAQARGSAAMDAMLWGGEYYVQRLDDVDAYRYQQGTGCLSDQLIGQFMAHVAGLGYVLPEPHVKKALRSVYRYNFRTDFSNHANVQRTYAFGDERGLLLCSWPHGGRPIRSFVQGGGKVIVVGSDSLSKDENNQPLNADDRGAVFAGSEVLPDSGAIMQSVRAQLSSLSLMNVVLRDKATGAIVHGVEWQSAVYNGKLLIDIANYDTSVASKTVSIEVNGRPAGTASELINGGTADTGSFILEQEKPYLLSVDAGAGTGGGGSVFADPNRPNTVKDAVIGVMPKPADGQATGSITADEFAKAIGKSGDGRSATVELQAVNGAKAYALQLPATLFAADNADRRIVVRTPQAI